MTNIEYLYNKDDAQKIFAKNYFVDKKLHFQIIERGTILPHKHMYVNGQWTWGFGGIVDSKNKFVKSSFVGNDGGEAYTPTEEIRYSPATVIYLGLFYPVWGHVLTDDIRCLWFLKSDVFNRYFKNCLLVYGEWGGVFLWNASKILKDCWRFLRLILIDFNRFITLCNLKISFCLTNHLLQIIKKENLQMNIARQST